VWIVDDDIDALAIYGIFRGFDFVLQTASGTAYLAGELESF
jgi:hypothetical protein